jgi:transposase
LTKTHKPDAKTETLRRQGTLHPHPDRVRDPLFLATDFFDPRDLVQVKYEMVRRVRVDGRAVSHTATAFAVSRPSFYQTRAVLDRGGLAALVPQKRGPRRAHKLGSDVMEFLLRERSGHPSLRSSDLAHRVREHFGRKVHPRSVERALARQEKKRP